MVFLRFSSRIHNNVTTVLQSSTTTVNTARDLGVMLDSQLTMSAQVGAACRSAYNYLRQPPPCRSSAVGRSKEDSSPRWLLRCRANVRGESVAVRRAAGRLFQMRGPATAKLLIPSVVVVLGTNKVPVSADRRCRLPAIAEIA